MSRDKISVSEETLSVTLPAQSARVLCAQPFIEFRAPLQEPFPLSPECQSRLLDGIDRVIDAANEQSAEFIVFPEFSIPGIEGVERLLIAFQSESISNATILVGGVTSLTVDEFASLLAGGRVEVLVAEENKVEHVREGQWINTSVTIVKDDCGQLKMWVQPKVSPSWPESATAHQQMFKGRRLHVFRATFENGLPCHFFSALCYDWIGREVGTTAPTAVLKHLNEVCCERGAQLSLNWVFVLQHNSKPNDDTFLSAAREFLTDPDYPLVSRDDAAILMACTASSRVPVRDGNYGCSSVIFNPRAPFDMGACPSTFTTSGSRIRKSSALRICKDAVFREMGECMHAFDIRNPRSVRVDSTDRTLPIENASVYPFTRNGPLSEARLPGMPVPAVVKWVHDELDNLGDLAHDCLAGCVLHDSIEISQASVVSDHRLLPSQAVSERVNYSKASSSKTAEILDPASQADVWDKEERDGLEHVVHSLAIVRSVTTIDVGSAVIHGRHLDAGVEIAAIRGTHHSDCIEAFEKWAAKTHSPLLLISRDHHNTVPLQREIESFADPSRSAGVKFTDAQTLLGKARSCTEAELRSFTSELFDATDRRII